MNNPQQTIGFLFDLDGVLIDSEGEYSKIWAQINREFPTGIPEFEKVIKGTTLSKILNDNYPDEEIRNAVGARLHALEEKMHYEYLPHAEEFLIKSRKKGIPCALVTSSDQKKMSHLKEELPGLLNYFDYVVTGNQVKTSKPSPEGYLMAAEKINVAPENCVVFEDSLQGVMAGRNANAYVVGISGTLPAETLAPYSHIVVASLLEIDIEHLILKLK